MVAEEPEVVLLTLSLSILGNRMTSECWGIGSYPIELVHADVKEEVVLAALGALWQLVGEEYKVQRANAELRSCQPQSLTVDLEAELLNLKSRVASVARTYVIRLRA